VEPSKEQELEARLARIESLVTSLQRSVEGLISERHASASRGGEWRQTAPPGATFSAANARTPSSSPPPRADFGSTVPDWLSSRTAEWWLSRFGVGFVVLGILILYGYAVDQEWITPPIRVLAGVVVGAIFLWAGTRVKREIEIATTDLGMRELLYGAALAIWYVTAYAASVWYQLISIPSARLLFLVLGIASTWIALQEHREIFAFVAVAVGFATPFILPAPLTSLPELALYLGAVSAIGLIIYLMRGWPSIAWITFGAFWLSIAATIYQNVDATVHPAAVGSLAISFLFIVSGAAFTRAPSLRRRLLLLGSDRYTPAPIGLTPGHLTEALDSLSKFLGAGQGAPDSPVLWTFTLLSPVLAIGMLGDLWPSVPTELWGVLIALLGVGALVIARRGLADEELRQVAFTCAALWTLLGILRIAPDPERLGLAALDATLIIALSRHQFVGPRTLAKVTILVSLAVVLAQELSPPEYGLLRWRTVIAELITLAGSAVIVRKLLADPSEKIQGIVLAIVSYLIALLVIANILNPIWAPLVTATYAVFGAMLLILSKNRNGERLMRQLGGVTMLIVVGRLLLVDLASVETIWRVLLFLVCGALFLYTGYRLQPTRAAEPK
jgi:uncharacterized membrane protein